jgi:RHS repeat-associated protein
MSADYHEFGMNMEGRGFSGSLNYRFGYQGSEKDNEVNSSNGSSYTTEFRQLDTRLGRWFSSDPVFQPWQSSYTSMDNNPVNLTDVLGDVAGDVVSEDGKGGRVIEGKDGKHIIQKQNENGEWEDKIIIEPIDIIAEKKSADTQSSDNERLGNIGKGIDGLNKEIENQKTDDRLASQEVLNTYFSDYRFFNIMPNPKKYDSFSQYKAQEDAWLSSLNIIYKANVGSLEEGLEFYWNNSIEKDYSDARQVQHIKLWMEYMAMMSVVVNPITPIQINPINTKFNYTSTLAAKGGGSAYDGVRAASKYLQGQGVPRVYRKQILESFEEGTISLRTADNATYGLRFYGGAANQSGRYLFPTFTNYTNRVGLALPQSWNSMSGISQFQIVPGSTYIFGRAASQGGIFNGGSYQIYINSLNNIIK